MLTLKQIYDNKTAIIAGLEKKHFANAAETIEQVIALDTERKAAQQKKDAASAEMNKISKSIGALMAQGKREEAEVAKAQAIAEAEGFINAKKKDSQDICFLEIYSAYNHTQRSNCKTNNNTNVRVISFFKIVHVIKHHCRACKCNLRIRKGSCNNEYNRNNITVNRLYDQTQCHLNHIKCKNNSKRCDNNTKPVHDTYAFARCTFIDHAFICQRIG